MLFLLLRGCLCNLKSGKHVHVFQELNARLPEEPQIRRLYAPLFHASHRPHEDSHEDLKRLFHIHSGGSEETIKYQIQTFKTLCEFASFDSQLAATQVTTNGQATAAIVGSSMPIPIGTGVAAIHIDLHIHLPENKTTRDYEAIIQDIARYIYGHEVTTNGQ